MALVVKNLPAIAGGLRHVGLIPGPGRSPGEGNGSPLQNSCLENPVDRGVWWATVGVVKSWTGLKWLSMYANIKSCSRWSGINKTMVRYYFITSRCAGIKKSDNIHSGESLNCYNPFGKQNWARIFPGSSNITLVIIEEKLSSVCPVDLHNSQTGSIPNNIFEQFYDRL